MKNKTVFVFGSGSTASLNIPTTEQQMSLLRDIDETKEPLLGKLIAILNGIFGKENYRMNDIFNIIDSNVLLQNAIRYKDKKIEAYELTECKRKLITYIFKNFQENLKCKDNKTYQKYVDFYATLAKNELLEKSSCKLECENRKFFLSSYSIINFNWDLYSLLPVIEANNVVNHKKDPRIRISCERNPSLRIFTDFNCEYACADSTNNKYWYPFSESAAFVVNSKKYDTTRRVVLVKCFYPHGTMNLFKCTECAKHSMYLGDLTLNSVANNLDYHNNKELYKCPYCGIEIYSSDFDILAQSNFKVRNSFLEEIRLSMTQELRTAKIIVFIGYSMPDDDVDYKTMFKSLNCSVEKVFVMLFEKESSNKFSPYTELNDDAKNIVRNFNEVFGCKATYNMSGVPNAFNEVLKILNVDAQI